MLNKKNIHIVLLFLFVFVNNFLFAQSPAISSFNPSIGPVGTIIKITGSNLSNPSGITIGGTQGIVVSATATQIVAMVMPGSSSGIINVSTPGGNTNSSSSFTIQNTLPPFRQQGSKLVGTGGIGSSYQGWSTAISADGNTAIVGGPFDKTNWGSAWVFTRSGSTWSQQGLKFSGYDSIADPNQGWAVALSADGNTALIGGPADSNGLGATWVFVRSGTTWSQQGNKLVGSGSINNGQVYQGNSVALSADGNTALIGGPYDNNFTGAMWVFKRTGSTWIQQGSKLSATGMSGFAAFGYSVSLSADGLTAIGGGVYDNNNIGAAWVFKSNGTTWSQEGGKIVGTGSNGSTVFQGYSVGLNANGNYAIVGAPYDNNSMGAAWIFTRSGSTWSQQGAKLVGSGSVGSGPQQGSSVTINAAGNICMLGAPFDNSNEGAAWVFTRNGSTWSQNGTKLVGTGNTGSAQQGFSVNISASGSDAILGGFTDNSLKGASWIFIPPSSNPDLSNLVLSTGAINPSFSSSVVTYTNNASSASSTVNVTATVVDAATIMMRINGGSYVSVASGSPSPALPLNVGNNVVDVLVTAQDGVTTKTYTITINRACPGISAVLSGSTAICSGASASITVNITGGASPYDLIYSGVSVNNYVSGTAISVSPTTNTTYTLSGVTDNDGCSASLSGSATITIKSVVAIGSVSASANPICASGTTNLTANSVSGTNATVNWWTGTGGTGSNLGSGTTLNSVGVGTYFARVTGDCGNPVEAQITITQTTVPVISNQSTSTCGGIAFSVNPSGVPTGTTYSWTVPSYSGTVTGGSAQSLQSSISQVLSVSGNNPGTASYSVTPTVSGCNGNPFTVTVTVNPNAVVSNILDTICSGQSFTISPSGVPTGTTYSWALPVYNGNVSGGSAQTNQSNISQTLTVSGASAGTATYNITPQSGSCTGPAFTLIVRVNPIPASPNISDVACSNQPFTITPSGLPTGTLYSWGNPIYSGNVSGGSAQTGQTNISQTLSLSTFASGSALYSVTPSFGGCNGTPFNVQVVVAPTPSASNVTITECSGQSFTVNPSGMPSGTTYTWGLPTYTGSVSGGSAQSAQNNITETLYNGSSTSGTATYTVTPSTGACSGSPFIITATINPEPVISNKSVSVCSGQAFSTNITGVASGTVYSWSAPVYSGPVSGGSAQTGQTAISQTLNISGSVSGTATYTILPVSGTCTGASFNVIVTVNPLPTLSSLTQSVCSGESFTIQPSGAPAGTVYSWVLPSISGDVTGATALTAQSSISQNLINNSTVPGTATYTINPLSGTCPGNSFNAIITINPLPIPTFTSSTSDTTCATNMINYVTQSGMNNYTWTVPGIQGTDYTIISGGTGTSNNQVALQWLTAGNKSVAVKYTNANNCTAGINAVSSTYIDLGVTPSVSIAITSGTNPTCSNAAVTFTATPINEGLNATYKWFKNGVQVPSVSGLIYTINGFTTTTSVYVIMTPGSDICVNTPSDTSNMIQVNLSGNTWTGNYSAVWADSRNWCLNVSPTATSDVYVPLTARKPIVYGNSAVNNIIVDAGAGIIINNCTLTINGTTAGQGKYVSTGNGVLTLASNGSIGTLYIDTPGIASIVFTGSGSATLGNAVNIFQELNIRNATLITNDNLTLKSNEYGTAWLAPIVAGNISGKVTVERYISRNAFRAWRMLSVPVMGTQTFKQAWQEGQTGISSNLYPGYGTLLTNTTGANGYDAATTGNSLLSFNPGTPGTFSAVTSTFSPMQTSSGYFVYIRGDRSASIQQGIVNPTATTLRTNGLLYTGTQPAVTLPPGQNVMVGNVYAAPIDFSQLIKSNINAFKVWDPKLYGTYNVGAYQTFSAINGYDPTPGGGSYGNISNSRIESGQAFIVSSASGGSIQLVENAKTNGSRSVFRNNNVTIQQFKTNLVAIQNDQNFELADGNSIVFDKNYSNLSDEGDVLKTNNFGENIGLSSNGKTWVIETRKPIVDKDTINYSLLNLKKQNYLLEFIPKNIETDIIAFVEDKYTGETTIITMDKNSKIQFTVDNDLRSSAADRFRLIFKKLGNSTISVVDINAYKNNNNIKVDWVVNAEKEIATYEIEHSIDGVTFTKAGYVHALTNNKPLNFYSFVHNEPVTGYNYYRIKIISVQGDFIYSAVKKVTLENTKTQFTVFPNPVTNSKMNIQFVNQPKGNYTVRIMNTEGKLYYTTKVYYEGGTSNKVFDTPSTLPAGTYQLNIIRSENQVFNQRIILSNFK